VLTPGVFDLLAKGQRGVGGEIQLTDAIEQLTHTEKVFAHRYEGRRYDCGSKLGLLQASVDLAEHHSEVGQAFSAWLNQRTPLNARELGAGVKI
jgi:UTP--glucose-1-phosphate uridylyltransferase